MRELPEFLKQLAADENRIYRAWLRLTEPKESTNIFNDVTITEDEFIYYIKQMFLGDDWFIEDPISTSQINTIAFCDIYRMYKHPSLLFWKMFKDKLKRMLLKW